ncbi:hypothetical protein SynBIOSU31_02953 [Synechococcus sp. BIOS-U3-1]|nr:hypothetical protein SynBIOSU31_02953 [Synechococcus sp. BIOS-U3-1]
MTKREANTLFIKEVISLAGKGHWTDSFRVKLASRILLGRVYTPE